MGITAREVQVLFEDPVSGMVADREGNELEWHVTVSGFSDRVKQVKKRPGNATPLILMGPGEIYCADGLTFDADVVFRDLTTGNEAFAVGEIEVRERVEPPYHVTLRAEIPLEDLEFPYSIARFDPERHQNPRLNLRLTGTTEGGFVVSGGFLSEYPWRGTTGVTSHSGFSPVEE